MTKPQQYARRLSSGSACETCRRRKTKCDGGQPCAFCSSNGIQCSHRLKLKKKIFTVMELELAYRPYPKYGRQGSTLSFNKDPKSNHQEKHGSNTNAFLIVTPFSSIPSITGMHFPNIWYIRFNIAYLQINSPVIHLQSKPHTCDGAERLISMMML